LPLPSSMRDLANSLGNKIIVDDLLEGKRANGRKLIWRNAGLEGGALDGNAVHLWKILFVEAFEAGRLFENQFQTAPLFHDCAQPTGLAGPRVASLRRELPF